VSTSPQNSPGPNQRSSLLGSLLPACVAVVERRAPGDPSDLKPVEAHYVARARAKRLNEFAAGRSCARAALELLGVHDAVLPAADDRQPVWPSGCVGSITHTEGFCAAAVAPGTELRALGIDSEIVGAPTSDLWPVLCGAAELSWVDSLPVAERSGAVTLVFSAKEAFYKCQYPLVAEWLDFHDLRIDVAEWGMTGEFRATALRTIRFAQHVRLPITGRYVFHQHFVSAAVWVVADSHA
jgi:4'-phosphopantetheinyl transferase EntD